MSTDMTRVGFLTELVNGFPFESKLFTDSPGIPLVRIRDITAGDFETFVPSEMVPDSVIIRDGDVVIGMDGDFNTVLWKRGPAAMNQRVCLLRPLAGTDMRFIAYAIPPELQRVNTIAFSTTVKHLSSSDVLSLPVPAMSPDSQRRIADYLDDETAELDTMVRELEHLVDVLNERRYARQLAIFSDQTLLHAPLGAVADVSLGKMLDEKKNVGDLVPYVRAANVSRRGHLDLEDLKVMKMSPAERDRLSIRAGDIMMIEGGDAGRVAYVDEDVPGIAYQKTVMRIRVDSPDVDSKYLFHALQFAHESGRIAVEHSVSTIAHFTAEKAVRLPVPVPRLMDQRDVVNRIEADNVQMDAMINDARRLKALLAERRYTLIADVITGRKEVA